MASSDNVLRGGLTPKHVDVAELLEVVDFRVLGVPLLEPRRVGEDELLFAPDVDDFALTVLDVHRPTTWERAVPRAMLCLEGSVTVTSAAGRLPLERGQSAFATAAEHPVTVEGSGRVVAATPGER
jgi:mannose-6-phosphate isomerase